MTQDINVDLDPTSTDNIGEIATALWGIKEQMDIQFQATGYEAHDPVLALNGVASALREIAGAIHKLAAAVRAH